MTSIRRTILIGLIIAWALPVWSHSEIDSRNRVSLQVEAMREVPNDWTTARLSVVAEGKDPAAIANSVNRQMASALAVAKRTEGVDVESGAYVTQPVYDDGRVVRWRASQVLRLESDDIDRIAKLIGELQGDAVVLSNIAFSVKPATRTAVEEELIEEALSAFRSRATLIAKGMGEKNWSLISLTVGQSGGQPRMAQMRAESHMSSMSKSTAPALEAGTSEIRVQASGKVELD
jgi:predicted secreted protein